MYDARYGIKYLIFVTEECFHDDSVRIAGFRSDVVQPMIRAPSG
jgi:hypothetical protein